MKIYFSIAFSLLLSNSIITANSLFLDKDYKAIESQKGCFKVDFWFKEVESLKDGYEVKPNPYKASATELVVMESNTDKTKIFFQHVLIHNKRVIKHWSHQWEKNRPYIHEYTGNNTWTKKFIDDDDLWSQRVFQVDDSPRYECAAKWNHSDKGSNWQCKTYSPLPRREKKRKDYNILVRGNNIVVEENGYLHKQDNIKLMIENNEKTPLVREEGLNTYTKIDDGQCIEGKNWWLKSKEVWSIIRSSWDQVYENNEEIVLKEKIDGKKLWQAINLLANKYIKLGTLSTKQKDQLQSDFEIELEKWM